MALFQINQRKVAICNFPLRTFVMPAVLFHHRARGHFLGSFPISPAALRGPFDVFIFPLFLGGNALETFSSWHKLVASASLTAAG
jgi:hypothetical protein